MRSLKKLLLGMAAAAIVTLTQYRAEALLIDSFDSNPAPALNLLVDSGNTDSNTQTGVTGVIGGDRDAKLTVSGGLEGADARMRILGAANGRLSMISNDDATGVWELDYSPLTAFDITEGGTIPGITMEFLSADSSVTVEATLSLVGPSTTSRSLVYPGGVGPLFFDFSQFGPTPVTAATSVTGIHFKITGVPDGDYNIDFINAVQAVPEPSTWAMFGLGLVGLAGWGWRRRRQRAAA